MSELSKADLFWNEFLLKTGRDEQTKCSGDLFFEAKGFVGNELISLVMSGRKTAFFSSFATYSIDQEPLPVSGELFIVFDNQENPCCVIEIESVNIIPFNEISWEMAKKEGEDNSLQEWRERKQEILEDEGAILGFDFSLEIKLVFQTFSVVYKK